MSSGYIDTSFLLSILFEDENYESSVDRWNNLELMFSSVLLEVESRISLYRYWNETSRSEVWYRQKEQKLHGLLAGINRRTVDEEIVEEVKNLDQLKQARSLDGIHLATAHIINRLSPEKLLLCSYDKRMKRVGRTIGLQIG